MGRKSSVARMDPAARKYLEKLLREDRHTRDELLAARSSPPQMSAAAACTATAPAWKK